MLLENLNVPGEWQLDPAHDATFVGIFEGFNDGAQRVWKVYLLINHEKCISVQ